jgi:hypothetical protein
MISISRKGSRVAPDCAWDGLPLWSSGISQSNLATKMVTSVGLGTVFLLSRARRDNLVMEAQPFVAHKPAYDMCYLHVSLLPSCSHFCTHIAFKTQ